MDEGSGWLPSSPPNASGFLGFLRPLAFQAAISTFIPYIEDCSSSMKIIMRLRPFHRKRIFRTECSYFYDNPPSLGGSDCGRNRAKSHLRMQSSLTIHLPEVFF